MSESAPLYANRASARSFENLPENVRHDVLDGQSHYSLNVRSTLEIRNKVERGIEQFIDERIRDGLRANGVSSLAPWNGNMREGRIVHADDNVAVQATGRGTGVVYDVKEHMGGVELTVGQYVSMSKDGDHRAAATAWLRSRPRMTVAESADRFAAWRRRVHPVFATVGPALMVLLVGAIVIPHGSASGIPGDLLVGVYMPSVAALVVLIVGRSKTLDVLAIRLPFLQAAAWIMISTAVLVTLATAVLKLTGHSFSEDSYLMRTGAFPVWAVEQIAAATTFPFMEEVVFRGVIQTELKKRFGAIAAVLVTSTLFGFYHYDGTLEFARIGVLCCAGLVFGIVRERTDSLGAPIAVHGLYNAAISCLEFVA